MPSVDRNYWIWSTTPEYYEQAPGRDRSDLRAGHKGDWWTCAKGTERGDLALLWRTKPRSDIGYLMRAETDAFPLHDDRYARKQGWRFGCEYRVLFKFKKPLTVGELRADDWLAKAWGSLRSNFQGKAAEVAPHVWGYLLRAMRRREGAALSRALERGGARLPRLLREKEVEQDLMSKPSKLRSIAPRLRLWNEDRRIGRQLTCPETGGRLDLLFATPGNRTLLVVEVKVVRATAATFGQVSSYMGWVQEHMAGGKPVKGLVVAPDKDAAFAACQRTNPRVQFRSLQELGYAKR